MGSEERGRTVPPGRAPRRTLCAHRAEARAHAARVARRVLAVAGTLSRGGKLSLNPSFQEQ
ncbi:protein of unknown function [Paraburkholderia kururiensis]